MSAPAGLCGSCGLPMQWCFIGGGMFVRCKVCMDLFEEDGEVARILQYEKREGREA